MGTRAPDLSVVIVAHAEGRLVHRGLASIQRAAESARADGFHVEVLAILDQPTEATRVYFSTCKLADRIEQIDVGDVSAGRNHGVSCAKGRFVTLIDGDDLVSSNWFTRGLALLNTAAPDVIAHPEYSIRFGDRSEVWRKRSQDDPDLQMFSMLWANPWDVTCMASRDLFIQHPYQSARSSDGWGYEDYHWHCETVAAGLRHVVVPETVLFVRTRAQGSRWHEHTGTHCVLRPSRLYDPGFLRSRLRATETQPSAEPSQPCPSVHGPGSSSLAARVARRLRNYWTKQSEALGLLFAPIRPPVQLDRLPPTVRQEWLSINSIEPALYPDPAATEMCGAQLPWHARATQAYLELAEGCGSGITHFFLVPWLLRGGSDLEVLNYVKALVRLMPSSRIVVLATENCESPWKDRLPAGVRFIEYGRRYLDLAPDTRAEILLRVLLQTAPKRIHLVNSMLGYSLLIRHGRALRQISRLYASLFCPETFPTGRIGGFALEQLPACFDHLEAIGTDNQTFVDQLCRQFGFDPTRFHTHYQPIVAHTDRNKDRPRSDVLRVLWASRLDRQKRVDLLAEIAHQCRDFPMHFHVHGATLLAADPAVERLRSARNVTLHGPYDGFASLPLQDYDVFLYTSQFDGIPNVLLEAMAAGLPVIASDVGGVGEVVRNNETGWLVTPHEDVSRYVGCLQELHRNREIAKPIVTAASALLAARHSETAFDQRLLTFPGYVDPAGQAVAAGTRS